MGPHRILRLAKHTVTIQVDGRRNGVSSSKVKLKIITDEWESQRFGGARVVIQNNQREQKDVM